MQRQPTMILETVPHVILKPEGLKNLGVRSFAIACLPAGRLRMTELMKLFLVFSFMFSFFPVLLFADAPPKRDIFQSTIKRPVAGGQPVAGQPVTAMLQGISISSKGSFAVINGMVLHEGEEKSGIKAVKIRRREVDIEVSGVSRTLQMVVYEGAAGKGPRPEAPQPEEGLPEEGLEETVQEESSEKDSEPEAGL